MSATDSHKRLRGLFQDVQLVQPVTIYYSGVPTLAVMSV